MSKAVVLAAGRGTRMRAESPEARLDEEQRRMADQGLKALIPFHGQPYLSYVLSALADAGVTEACLVIGPHESSIREYYERAATPRIRIAFAVQERPLGTAHALLAAESFTGPDFFLMVNSDNYYPPAALSALLTLEGSGMAGFRSEVLTTRGNLPPSRVAGYALVTTDPQGFVDALIEKPRRDEVARLAGRAWVSMNCWRFGPSIFQAARGTDLSPRGEYELPDAVARLIRAGERLRVVPVDEPVLDLSSRADVETVSAHLRGIRVRL